jgi:hypothetical protein
LLNRNPLKRLGALSGAAEIKSHSFFRGIDWQKVIRKEYRLPDPYLKKRFENFIRLNPTINSHTDAQDYEQKRREAMLQT